EADNVGDVLRVFVDARKAGVLHDIAVLDGGSTDGSQDVVRTFLGGITRTDTTPENTVIDTMPFGSLVHLPEGRNKGKHYTYYHGIRRAVHTGASIVFYSDADMRGLTSGHVTEFLGNIRGEPVKHRLTLTQDPRLMGAEVARLLEDPVIGSDMRSRPSRDLGSIPVDEAYMVGVGSVLGTYFNVSPFLGVKSPPSLGADGSWSFTTGREDWSLSPDALGTSATLSDGKRVLGVVPVEGDGDSLRLLQKVDMISADYNVNTPTPCGHVMSGFRALRTDAFRPLSDKDPYWLTQMGLMNAPKWYAGWGSETALEDYLVPVANKLHVKGLGLRSRVPGDVSNPSHLTDIERDILYVQRVNNVLAGKDVIERFDSEPLRRELAEAGVRAINDLRKVPSNRGY
ncbi:hypothetical protein ACFLRF_06680, partial [Candidatus Altiarchaeota archaeon]